MAGERHGRDMLFVNRPLDLATTGTGPMYKLVTPNSIRATVGPLLSGVIYKPILEVRSNARW
jgi:hypothetical protein